MPYCSLNVQRYKKRQLPYCTPYRAILFLLKLMLQSNKKKTNHDLKIIMLYLESIWLLFQKSEKNVCRTCLIPFAVIRTRFSTPLLGLLHQLIKSVIVLLTQSCMQDDVAPEAITIKGGISIQHFFSLSRSHYHRVAASHGIAHLHRLKVSTCRLCSHALRLQLHL